MKELVMAILEKSKIEDVPIDIAFDMLSIDENKDDLKIAYEILDKYYVAITALRRIGRTAEIDIIIQMAEDGADVKSYIEDLKKIGII